MLDTLLDTDNAVLFFKGREWGITRDAPYEWEISSSAGDGVGTLRCVTAAGAEHDPVFALTLPGPAEVTQTEGTDLLSIIEYAINEYLDRHPQPEGDDVIARETGSRDT